MTDTYWTSWGITGSNTTPEKYAEVMAVDGVVHDPKRGIPLFHGSLDDFSKAFDSEFTVHKTGRFISVGDGEDV